MTAPAPSFPPIAPVVLAMAALVAMGQGSPATKPASGDAATDNGTKGAPMSTHPYVGMWVTADGRIRQELLPDGRYDEARGTRKSAYQGRYEVRGRHIDYWDDTGFTADGTFVTRDELRHGGMIFHREKE